MSSNNAIRWSPKADATILRLRAAGLPWKQVASNLRVGRNSVIERARRLGLPPIRRIPKARPVVTVTYPERLPLPAGHPITWEAITAGSVLQDEPYPYPVFL